jgi:hypothetical protein
MDMAALHADISDAARLATEDRLEELLETFPFAGPVSSKQTDETPIPLEAVVETIYDHADPRAAAESDEEFGARDRRPLSGAVHRNTIVS